MFCHKCGTEIAEGAGFCQKCGAKLITEEPRQAAPAQPVRQPSPAIPQEIPQKKKSKKKLIIFGMAALALVVIILAVAMIFGGETDYIGSIQQKMPFESNEGLSITYGEVFAKYIQDAKWKVDETDKGATAEISGTVKGTELPILVEITVKLDPNNRSRCSIKLSSLTVGESHYAGVKAEAVLFAIFKAYENGDKDFAGMEHVLLGTIPVETELTETYADEEAGYSFRYPRDWTLMDSGYTYRVEMIHNENTAEHRATIEIVSDFVDVLDVFSGDEDTVKSNFTEDGATFLSLEDTELGGVPAKKLTHKSDDLLSGKENIVTTFYYKQGETGGWVRFSCAEDTSDQYGPVFDAIADSFTITVPEPTPAPASAEGICLYGVPVSEYFSASLQDVRKALDISPGNDRNDAVRLYMSNGEITSIEIWDADALTQGGESLKKNRNGLAALLGEPNDENTASGEYSVSYYRPECSIRFELGAASSEAWRVTVGPPKAQADDMVYYVEQDTTFYLEDDSASWITLYKDGTFDMQVNLYEGYGPVYGTYEGTTVGFTCNVTGNGISGFIGSDVETFDLVIGMDGSQNEILQYRGAQIGTTLDWAVYR